MQLGAWGALWAPPAGSEAEHQRKSKLVHFSRKIWHLVAQIFHFPCPFPDHSSSLTFSRLPWPVGTVRVVNSTYLSGVGHWWWWRHSCPVVNDRWHDISALRAARGRHAGTSTNVLLWWTDGRSRWVVAMSTFRLLHRLMIRLHHVCTNHSMPQQISQLQLLSKHVFNSIFKITLTLFYF